MNFSLNKSIEILERTPDTLISMLDGISPEWTEINEGAETWSVYDIVGHLIHGEVTDWIPRMEIILSDNSHRIFQPFDRFAQFENSKGKNLHKLLIEFKKLRMDNLYKLKSQSLNESKFEQKGFHPALGEVTLSQLLSTWTVHDLNHISQISRVMAKQYTDNVGPWIRYLKILNE